MTIQEFEQSIKKAISFDDKKINQFILTEIENIVSNQSESSIVNMTCLTIFFESFYRYLADNSDLKNKLLVIRKKRWANHFGTPTVTFLISYREQIEKTISEFRCLEALDHKHSSMRPWLVKEFKELDLNNEVIVSASSINKISLPEKEEKSGEFVKTYNPSGGFTTTPCDPYSNDFIEYSSQIAKQGGKVLEIGSAFGAASLQALFKGVTVYSNDIEAQNLAVIKNRFMQEMKMTENSITGDDGKLFLLPGSFPEELEELPQNFFDAVLICRVMHFFSGEKIERSLNLIRKVLKPEGQLYIVCETPFLKNWQKFIPEYTKRVTNGIEWPGEINNPAEFESSGRVASLPRFVHWMSKEILDKALIKCGFFISKSSYINRKGQFPDDLILNGQESVGVLAIKKC